jgi:hypothetical protein
MIIRCVETKFHKIKTSKNSELLLRHFNYSEGFGEDATLKIGQCYVVYAMFEGKDYKWYFIRYRTKPFIAHWYPEFFFEVVDSHPSKYWMTDWNYELECGAGIGPLHAFPEYGEIDEFYVKLVEHCEEATRVFEDIAKKIRDEAVL